MCAHVLHGHQPWRSQGGHCGRADCGLLWAAHLLRGRDTDCHLVPDAKCRCTLLSHTRPHRWQSPHAACRWLRPRTGSDHQAEYPAVRPRCSPVGLAREARRWPSAKAPGWRVRYRPGSSVGRRRHAAQLYRVGGCCTCLVTGRYQLLSRQSSGCGRHAAACQEGILLGEVPGLCRDSITGDN